uniref:CDAN1-interacting nuclease 1 n=1 Tax=Tetraselmis sp. GSL018 TaxID=582737 RepID=A0A061RSC3_9CHLO
MEQYQQYVNRYGPGLVIYWFGFVRELQDNPDVLLVDDFPGNIKQLPRLPLPGHDPDVERKILILKRSATPC